MKIGIIGAGMVGGAIEHCFDHAHELFIHDPVRGTTLSDVTNNVDMAFEPMSPKPRTTGDTSESSERIFSKLFVARFSIDSVVLVKPNSFLMVRLAAMI